MNNNSDYNLYSKHKLNFNSNGKFKILMLSDIQETLDYNPKTFDGIRKLINKENPDLVVLGGDNCNGLVIKTEAELDAYLDILTAPMEERKIPWMHVFGNHDHDIEIDDLHKTKMYEKYEYCISKHTENIYGTTNFVLPIYYSNKQEVAFHLWGMDSNNLISESDIEINDKTSDIPNVPTMSSVWDILHFEQLMWYYNSSKELEDYSKKKVDGIMFMHIPLWEFQYIVDNPEATCAKGSMVETMGMGKFNSGLFATIMQRGDIKCIACGHSHNDCFEGIYCNVKMCLDACAGYSPYGTDSLRGGRVFVLDENDTARIDTYMVHYKDM